MNALFLLTPITVPHKTAERADRTAARGPNGMKAHLVNWTLVATPVPERIDAGRPSTSGCAVIQDLGASWPVSLFAKPTND